jgi:hypothetical protein
MMSPRTTLVSDITVKPVVTLQASNIQRREVGSRSETWPKSSRAEPGSHADVGHFRSASCGGVALVMPMSSAFEPVNVTPWSSSAPHARGRDNRWKFFHLLRLRPLPTLVGVMPAVAFVQELFP